MHPLDVRGRFLLTLVGLPEAVGLSDRPEQKLSIKLEIDTRPPVVPNVRLLQAALDQTQGPGRFTADVWRTLMRARLASLSMAVVRRDVIPFLERRPDADLLTAENLTDLLAENP